MGPYDLIYQGDHSGKLMSIFRFDNRVPIKLNGNFPMPEQWFDYHNNTFYVYYGGRTIPSWLYTDERSNVVVLSDISDSKTLSLFTSYSIVILDIKNGADVLIDFSGINGKIHLPIFIGKEGYNQYSLLRIKSISSVGNIQFINLPSTMRVIIEDVKGDYTLYHKPRFINSKCSVVYTAQLDMMEGLKLFVNTSNGSIPLYQSGELPAIEGVEYNSPIDRIRLFNKKRGLIEQGFDLKRELNFIMEEVIEATNKNLGSDKAKEKAKVIIDELLKDADVSKKNTLDSLIDIFVFVVGAMYKLAPKMNIDVMEEISKVLDNIEFKPYIKDENGKVIKDENYKKFREKK